MGEKIKSILLVIVVVSIISCIIANVKDNGKETNTEKDLKNKFYYNQLDSGYKKYGKSIYKKLYENKDNLEKSSYKITFSLNNFDVKSSEEIDYEKSKNIYTSFLYATSSFLIENPDIFWIDENKIQYGQEYSYYYLDCGKDYQNWYMDGIQSQKDIENMKADIEKSISNIKKELEGLDNYNKIKRIHDYLCETITYDKTTTHAHDMYGALVEKKCACDGYAKAFQYFMNLYNIESIVVVGEGSEIPLGWDSNHAWNYVKLNNSWYAVDATWDDVNPDAIQYNYFLKGRKTMEKDHTVDVKGQFYNPFSFAFSYYVQESFDYPLLNGSDY